SDTAFATCVSVLRSYHSLSATALRCSTLLELGDRTLSSRICLAVHDRGIGDEVAHQAVTAARIPELPRGAVQDTWSALGGDGFGSGPGLAASSSSDPATNQSDLFAKLWMDDQLDWAWLSKVPFEQNSESVEWWNL
ncbi:hypothetical protein LTR12_018001, partial [Friedmanniomyces endolithicus]